MPKARTATNQLVHIRKKKKNHTCKRAFVKALFLHKKHPIFFQDQCQGSFEGATIAQAMIYENFHIRPR